MSNFHLFKQAVAEQFALMRGHALFRVSATKDELWNKYQESFPEGSNPIYRERREHDCTCCKQFIRAVGDVVAIIDGELVSIWDGIILDPAYSVVAKALSDFVKSRPIEGFFYHYESSAGTDKTFEEITDGGLPVTNVWKHFHVNIPAQFVKPKKDIPSAVGEYGTLYDVMLRSLSEINSEAVDTVIELIEQGTLYRGEEHKAALVTFKKAQKIFREATTPNAAKILVWKMLSDTQYAYIARMRNTVIGTLLTDISDGVDLEKAVKAFEVKVAPTNYKRPTALITQTMINKAKEKISELGLTSALERRYARMEDVPANEILFVDRSTRKISQDIFDDLTSTKSAKPKSMDKLETITVDKFVSDVLPKIESMQIMFEGKHQGNLFSLIAPADPTAGNLFKWDNGYSWAYNGDLADSIKERVKQAGGNVTGDLCCRLAWEYRDDLDFHMREPAGGSHIYFCSRTSRAGGQLDVDANGGNGMMAHPVENIFYTNRRTMLEGEYHLYVNNYYRRDASSSGFDAEIDFLGDVRTFHYDKAIRDGENVTVAKFLYTHANGIEIIESLSGGRSSKEVWGLTTNQFHKVKAMMLSPNFWGNNAAGNRHLFFVLEGAKNEGDARGFFNEFLSNNLNEHRKVFEVVGSKMKATEGAEDQLSGLGFSFTKKDELIVKVTGSFTRTLRIQF